MKDIRDKNLAASRLAQDLGEDIEFAYNLIDQEQQGKTPEKEKRDRKQTKLYDPVKGNGWIKLKFF